MNGIDLSLLASVMTPEADLREVRRVYGNLLVMADLHVFVYSLTRNAKLAIQ